MQQAHAPKPTCPHGRPRYGPDSECIECLDGDFHSAIVYPLAICLVVIVGVLVLVVGGLHWLKSTPWPF